jgi:hypothetical protein
MIKNPKELSNVRKVLKSLFGKWNDKIRSIYGNEGRPFVIYRSNEYPIEIVIQFNSTEECEKYIHSIDKYKKCHFKEVESKDIRFVCEV